MRNFQSLRQSKPSEIDGGAALSPGSRLMYGIPCKYGAYLDDKSPPPRVRYGNEQAGRQVKGTK
jgi:hypothetical protein